MQLTQEQKLVGRRNFLKAAATLPAAGAFGFTAMNAGPVKAGVIGTGMEGRVLIEALNPKYIHLHGYCDIRPDNRAIAHWVVTQKLGINKNPVVYDDYKQMLDDPEIEAVIIATPLFLHGPMTIDALKAGKHVFVEKTMAYTVEECEEMISLAKQNNLNLQVGHMKFYNPLYWDAYRMLTEGWLGNVYHARMAWHRNTDWNYWKHIEQKHYENVVKFDATQHGYNNVEELVNWRWYDPTSHGMWTELCSHQVAISNWFFGDVLPNAVQGYGVHAKSIDDLNEHYSAYTEEDRRRLQHYTQDTRTINDHEFAIFEYPDNRVVTYSAIQSNAYDKAYEMFMGTHGTVILMSEVESYLFWEPGWDEAKAKEWAENGGVTQVGVKKEASDGSAVAAHATAGEATGGGGAADMSIMDPYKWELEGFAHTIRTGAPNLCDGLRGAQCTAAVLAAQEATKTLKRTELKPIVV